jgi:hypothetical protein
LAPPGGRDPTLSAQFTREGFFGRASFIPFADRAYEVQALNAAKWVAQRRRIGGRKMGPTGEAVEVQLGVDQPDFGAYEIDVRSFWIASHSTEADRETLSPGYAGACSSFRRYAENSAKEHGLDTRTILIELGRSKRFSAETAVTSPTSFWVMAEMVSRHAGQNGGSRNHKLRERLD